MTEKIIEYRTVSSPNIAKRAVEYFENKYHIPYDWGLSYGEIEDAVAVCVLELDSGYRFVTTTRAMDYIGRRRFVGAIDIGEL